MLNERLERLLEMDSVVCEEKVTNTVGSMIEVSGISASVGDIYTIDGTQDSPPVLPEVVGSKNGSVLLIVHGDVKGVGLDSLVRSIGRKLWIPVGDFLIGRTVDATGHPINGKGEFPMGERYGVGSAYINPLERPRISERLTFGIKTIDRMLTIGKGQRMGIFAGSGVGKSTLMGMIAKNVAADVNVIVLVGERRREVAEFMEKDLGLEGLACSVLVVATSDQLAMYRLKCAMVITVVAECLKDRGKDVLLMMDSLARFAMAHREIGLAAGKPLIVRRYTPGIYSELPKLLEYSGNFKQGPITGTYTVLAEGNDANESISDIIRGIIDGYIVLSRELAHKNHYPAIDVNTSISRLANDIVPEDYHQAAGKVRNWLSVYWQNEDLISIGTYKSGPNFHLNETVKKIDSANQFLCQQANERFSSGDTIQTMKEMQQRMKKSVFTLEKVLRFHEQELDVKKQELSALRVDLRDLNREIQRLKPELPQLNQEMSRAMVSGLNARDTAVYKMYFRPMELNIRRLETQWAELRNEVEEKQTSVVQMSQEISGLEKLRDKQFDEYNAGCHRQQELEIEEFVSQGIRAS